MRKTKKRNLWLTALLLPLLLAACAPLDNYGFPRIMKFGKEGGSKVCVGSESFGNISIHDYDGNGPGTITQGEYDTVIVTYDWLTVKYRYPQFTVTHFKMTAQPNTTGRKRTLYVSVAVDDFSADIKVTQR
ncbi:BACON domain-containing protein [Prevotella sp. HUN102]|uniref:BACON domain-containing protein n=1 Tax=Prevotella sp. HUN102 TaxID=1392486 RepID=UPI00048F3C14|nr:BACON domain-containing carbohydrate-binding protein [Prevotella sp. HUN102]